MEGARLRLTHARQPAETARSPVGRHATTATRWMATAAAPPAPWSRPTHARDPLAAFRHVFPDVETAPGSDQKNVMMEIPTLVMAARLTARLSADGSVMEGTRLRLIHARQPAETARSLPGWRDATTATRWMATAAAPTALWSRRTSARARRHAACRHALTNAETASRCR